MYVIGTAGHVDHGKSALVLALTGIDPDRLREEKERGLTIDLGFAWLGLPGGGEVSIVDVPGHERFIKNMLAGVGGIDLALLVIAADEGVMPQTREHLAIIDLLGIAHGVVALTKADLVEPDLLELARADAEEVILGTTLEGAPVIACSAVTREGLDELVAALEAQLALAPAGRDIGRPRLPLDRAFTMPGFGTVVTGTLIDGSLRTGQEVEVLPGGLRSRVRGLQSHGRKVESAQPGRRTAVNLAGLAVEELSRGMVVTTPGWLRPATSLDVRLRAVGYLQRPVRHNLSVTVHTGSAEVEGKVLLLDRDELPPGETAWAQIRLAAPLAAIKGDRFIIRDPNDTLGGGRIIDTQAGRHRRFHSPTLAALEALEKGSPEELVATAIGRLEPVEAGGFLKQAAMEETLARETLRTLIETGELVSLNGGGLTGTSILYTKRGFEALTARAGDALAAYHRQSPLRRGMPREELRNRLGLPPRVFEKALARWVALGGMAEVGGAVALPGHEPALSAEQEARAQAFLSALRATPFSPATDKLVGEELLAYLEDRGDIVRVGDGVIFAAGAYREMVDRVTAHLRERKTVTLAQVRDMFGTSRKYAQALLEHLDAKRITRRTGDERVLR
ncbi:MAG: selenocysteine-specific translation elongation factor [Dehalococcoidia bacterium]|nr:selenocysteine-specific translation elongation factor [Dehalococcoidia bacterium]